MLRIAVLTKRTLDVVLVSASGRVVVNVNCHELTANFGELIFFNLRIIYGNSRSYKKTLGFAGRTALWSGIAMNGSGMVINLIFKIIPEKFLYITGHS